VDSAPDPTTAEAAPLELSVIVPARNEEDCIGDCLRSLVSQSEAGWEVGRDWEVIVVDDNSSDRTHQIAASFPEMTILYPPALEKGWTGKANACWAGAKAARGEWLLFTDADTVHQRGHLSLAAVEAERHNVAMLSYSPRQIVTGFWQRALMPLVFSELASVYPPKQVSDPHSQIAAANGQFLLVERDAYFSIGGHRTQGTNVLEDVAIARSIKREHPIRFRYAPEAISTRMYRTTKEMIEGWTKNLALLMPRPVYLAAMRALDLALFVGLPLLAFGFPWTFLWQKAAILLLWARTLWRFYARVARSNFPAVDIAISILGVPLFTYLLIRSTIDHNLRHSVTWKGRSYTAGRQA